MQIVDELMTPGCPQCAVKHLSAAVAYIADGEASAKHVPSIAVGTYMARALINLVETMEGYRTHFDFAIGLLQRAEEFAASSEASPARLLMYTARSIRVKLIAAGPGDDAVGAAVTSLKASVDHTCMALGHVKEAMRELPERGIDLTLDVKRLSDMITKIRDDYLLEPDATTAPADGNDKPATEGETDMATKKTVGKGAACKGTTKCACKGGKTKKGK